MNTIQVEDFKSIDDIVKAIDFLDTDSLKETLAYILKIYIIDKELAYDGRVYDDVSGSTSSESRGEGITLENPTFAELISEAKKKYSFPELNLFTIENDNVSINLNGTRHPLGSGGSGAPTRPARTESRPEPASSPANSNNGSADSPERFRNLELD
ncbi:MAG: hypothetical protein GY754_20415 [bacterium]|nr:hypothetical protein [bacterium]